MTDRQSLALANPIDPDDLNALMQFAATTRRGEQAYLAILSVDRKDGFWWHAGVSVVSSNLKPVPHPGLSNLQRRAAERVARELLVNVGRPDSERVALGRKVSAFDSQTQH
jgi:hypothetical protein